MRGAHRGGAAGFRAALLYLCFYFTFERLLALDTRVHAPSKFPARSAGHSTEAGRWCSRAAMRLSADSTGALVLRGGAGEGSSAECRSWADRARSASETGGGIGADGGDEERIDSAMQGEPAVAKVAGVAAQVRSESLDYQTAEIKDKAIPEKEVRAHDSVGNCDLCSVDARLLQGRHGARRWRGGSWEEDGSAAFTGRKNANTSLPTPKGVRWGLLTLTVLAHCGCRTAEHRARGTSRKLGRCIW
jgi:hypothetical protein